MRRKWTEEGLWNAIVGEDRSPDDVLTEAAEEWVTSAVREAREQGLADPRSNAALVELILDQLN